ncbi:GspE/PulE family protein [Brockia lithotrophica]|uniref:Type IV pilus assembly protein PilB n=1 Tax=Brockia lithotrophica TaxID=933949 RepID=A0A660KW95_9BACL|nr:GspE/PulE family protein [Brockia lithotrophica]RKQ84722.1 type IV pilus assembly protein PilB [Brockia lithotrophica]
MATEARKRLGDLLVEWGIITQAELEEALARQRKTRERLGDVLVSLGYVTEGELLRVLSSQLGIPQVHLSRYHPDARLVRLVPRELAERYRAVPFQQDGDVLHVAFLDPLDVFAIEDLERVTGLKVKPYLASSADFHNAVARLYSGEAEGGGEKGEESRPPEAIDVSSPAARFVTETLQRAARLRASDVHIEPFSDGAQVRFRIDGRLRREQTLPFRLYNMVVARIKILANMDIAERRRPQDGRMSFHVDDREIDVRVSSLPTIHGEKIVLRLLDSRAGLKTIDELGFSDHNYELFLRMIRQPHGIVLLTGPTGSGKTTTLYAALQYLKSDEVNITTIEDPVEYEIPGVNQVQVNERAGLTFAAGLRSLLRQDPDILMVGEIRDQETAEIAIRAALTGHLVLSTLHTNDAVGTVYRLVDMGVPPYLIAASLNGVVAQRLVRRVCPECAETYTPEAWELKLLHQAGMDVAELTRGRGCPTCGGTGYLGRIAVHEVLYLDEALRQAISEGAKRDELYRMARERGMTTLWEDALAKAVQGLTTVEEVLQEIAGDQGG